MLCTYKKVQLTPFDDTGIHISEKGNVTIGVCTMVIGNSNTSPMAPDWLEVVAFIGIRPRVTHKLKECCIKVSTGPGDTKLYPLKIHDRIHRRLTFP
jgi:hypothetical protein